MTPPTLSSPFTSTLIAKALARPGDDPIFSLNAEAKARTAAGHSVVNATLGALMEDDGRLAVMPVVSEAIAAVPAEKAAAYAPIAGDAPYLRAVIGDLFGSAGKGMMASCTAAATPGGTGALHMALMNFLEPGQSMLVPSFYWGPYRTLADHTSRGIETYSMFTSAGRFDVQAFEKALERQLREQGRALCVFNFPCNNPTGYSLDDAEWGAVADVVERYAAHSPVIPLIDYAYAAFGAPGSETWIRHAERMSRSTTVLVAWTVSKSFAQYGARVGALVAATADDDERERLKNAFGFACRGTWSNCNHAGLLAITELLSKPELSERVLRERARLRSILDRRVAVFNDASSRHGFRYPRYEGGFFVSVFAERAQEVAAHMRDQANVFVVPIDGAVRLALCSTPERDIPKLVDALAAALDARN